MASIDLQFVRNRKREIRLAIERSSPALIYSGSLGIVIIAVNKNSVRNRIGKILDRMAVVSRGELTASDLVHQRAASEAGSLARMMSRGDVLAKEPEQAVSSLLSRHYHEFLGEPLAVESCLVQLNESPATDYMAHIGPDGSVQLFERILYLGPCERQSDDTATEAKDSESERPFSETREATNAELRNRWSDHPTVASLVADLERMSELAPLFAAGKRRDVVILDRAALARRDFYNIYKRFTAE